MQNITDAIKSRDDIDFVVSTGDMCRDFFENDITYATNRLDYACCIGNHDAIMGRATDPMGYRWEIQPTQKQLYEKFFAPYKNKMGITINKNTSYWYKEFEELAVISIDYTARGAAYYNQWYWLEHLLNVYSKKKKPIFIMSHQMYYKNKVVYNCEFTYNEYYIAWNYYSKKNSDNIYNFMIKSYDLVEWYMQNAGLKVICWIGGHEHADCAYYSVNNNYPLFTIGSGLHDGYNDLTRTNNNNWRKDAVVNIYDYNPSSKSLVVTRLGSQSCYGGELRDMIAYEYDKNKFVSREARGTLK